MNAFYLFGKLLNWIDKKVKSRVATKYFIKESGSAVRRNTFRLWSMGIVASMRRLSVLIVALSLGLSGCGSDAAESQSDERALDRTTQALGPTYPVQINPSGYIGELCVSGASGGCRAGSFEYQLAQGTYTLSARSIVADDTSTDSSVMGTFTVDDGVVTPDTALLRRFHVQNGKMLVADTLPVDLFFEKYQGRIWIPAVFDGYGSQDQRPRIYLLRGCRYAINGAYNFPEDVSRQDSWFSAQRYSLTAPRVGSDALGIDDETSHYVHVASNNGIAEIHLEVAPVKVLFNHYVGRLFISNVFDTYGPNEGTAYLLKRRRYQVTVAESLDEVRNEAALSADGWAVMANVADGVTLSPDILRSQQLLNTTGKYEVGLRTVETRFEFNGYAGRVYGGSHDMTGPQAAKLYMIPGRRVAFGAAYTWDLTRDGDSWISPNKWSVLLKSNGKEFDLLDDSTKATFLHRDLTLTLRTSLITLNTSNYPGRLIVSALADSTGAPSVVVPLLVGRRYSVRTPFAKDVVRTNDELSAKPFGVGVDNAGKAWIAADDESARSLVYKGAHFKLRTATATIQPTGYTGSNLCINGVACINPRSTSVIHLVRSRKYNFAGIGDLTVDVNGACSGLPAPAGVLVTCAADSDEVTGCTDPSCANPPPALDDPFQLRAQHSGHCIEAERIPSNALPGIDRGTFQKVCNGNIRQRWRLRTVATGYQIVSDSNSSLCLHIEGASLEDGGRLLLGACSEAGAPGQIWDPRQVGTAYQLVSTNSNRCIDVPAISMDDGAIIDQWTCYDGAANELWAFEPLHPSLPPGGAVNVVVQNGNNSKCLTVPQGESEAVQKTCDSSDEQRWQFEQVVGGYQIRSDYDPDRCLLLPNESATQNSQVMLGTCSASGYRGDIWDAQSVGSMFNLVATHSNLCLSVDQGQQQDGAALVQYECMNTDNQLWVVTPLTNPCENRAENAPCNDGRGCAVKTCQAGVCKRVPNQHFADGTSCGGTPGTCDARTCSAGSCQTDPNRDAECLAEIAPYLVAPEESSPAPEPVVDREFNGALTGQMAVGPTGAATFTVPISLPPGIAGMVPNLKLVYSSQGDNDIAGQGWALSGLSTIHRCPKTKTQDGAASPVGLISQKDPICLDGKRLIENTPGVYHLENDETVEIRNGASTQGGPTDQLVAGFTVVTKSGEIRSYGSDSRTRVTHAITVGQSTTQLTGVWLLDRVQDQYGNYFLIHYNDDLGGRPVDADNNVAFLRDGVKVTTIDYTGNDVANKPVAPFNHVTFGYGPRDDVRTLRIRTIAAPRKERLKTIDTGLGQYKLTYVDEDPHLAPPSTSPDARMLPSRLARIEFCAGTTCMKPLEFDWEGGGYAWEAASAYGPPDRIDRPAPTKSFGTQFVDLDGDGLTDFVSAVVNKWSKAWRNSGHGFVVAPDNWALPQPLAKADNTPNYSILTDMNGDGLLDVVGPPLVSNQPPRIWINKIRLNQGWVPLELNVPPDLASSWGNVDFTARKITDGDLEMVAANYFVLDMDGDGRGDLVKFGALKSRLVTVFLNKASGWTKSPLVYDFLTTQGAVSRCALRDMNRDGMPDAVCAPGSGGASVALNIGGGATGASAWSAPSFWVSVNPSPYARHDGDIDGDGLFDTALVHPYGDNGCSAEANAKLVTFNIGNGATADRDMGKSAAYLSVLEAYIPHEAPRNGPLCGPDANRRNHLLSLTDLNADGLADLIINHDLGGGGDLSSHDRGGQLLINTGATWRDAFGFDSPSQWGGPAGTAVPAVPADNDPDGYSGDPTVSAAYLDLDGNGVTDVVRTRFDKQSKKVVSEAWLNKFKPAVIRAFSSGLGRKSTVAYLTITEEAAASTYDDAEPAVAGTTFLNIPLRVVSSVTAEDGTGRDRPFSIDYRYHSLRGSSTGRGPQGFKRVESTDNSSGVTTTTDYLQVYPYTGLAASVKKTRSGKQMSLTTTQFCDTVVEIDGHPDCTPMSGPLAGGPYSPRDHSIFVYPMTVVDEASLWSESNSSSTPETVTTTSDFRYDDRVNLIRATVKIVASATDESFIKTTKNTYGAEDSVERRMGRKTHEIVTSRRVTPMDGNNDEIIHTTDWEYGRSPYGAVVLNKVKVEPDAGAPVELHTAYRYDDFGNAIVTTVCGDSFDSCEPGISLPANTPNPIFRTSKVSYDPADFNGPQGQGLTPVLAYDQPGRFPVRTTNALGQNEYLAYDPNKGVLIQKTSIDGLHECNAYDAVGALKSTTSRCGSTAPLVTVTRRYLTTSYALHVPDGLSPHPVEAFITVVRPPTGAATWTYSDVFSRPVRSTSRSFNGAFVENFVKTYDAEGRLLSERRPSIVGSSDFSASADSPTTSVDYDSLGRVKKVTTDLAQINERSSWSRDIVTTHYDGMAISTDRIVGGRVQTRYERKNVAGKVDLVKDATGATTMTYSYDAESNLTDTFDLKGNNVHLEYDARGRKTLTRDPDLNDWIYEYNSFGEIVRQVDARRQAVTMTYDALGRLLTKTEAAGTSQWVYDDPNVGIGRLAATVSAPDSRLLSDCSIPHTTVTGGNRAGKSFAYNALGELETITECIDGSVFHTGYRYDQAGRQNVVIYPEVAGNALTVNYHYSSTGYLSALTNKTDGHVYWAAKTINALGQVTHEYTRNGVETVSDRNRSKGWLMSAVSTANADSGNRIADWTFGFDEAGSLLMRQRRDVGIPASDEIFEYDLLNRLTSARLLAASIGKDETVAFGYDALGNLTNKAGTTLTYSGCDAGPHALCQVDSGPRYSYDRNGNSTNSGGRLVNYNTNNKVSHMEAGGSSVDFAYGSEGQRVLQLVSSGSNEERTNYVGLGATGKSLYEKTVRGGTTEHVQFLYAGSAHNGNAFALRTVSEGNGSSAKARMNYLHFDHLGSVTAVSDDRGRVAASTLSSAAPGAMEYDPWGARRQPAGAAGGPSTELLPVGRRGFTGQESVPGVGLVNMNGRVYDPKVGRFLSADPEIQYVLDLQSYNRYSYVLNNPLSYTDPTGYRGIPSGVNTAINVGLVVGGAIACAGTSGAACVAISIAGTIYNTAAQIAAGASFEQIVIGNAFGVAFGHYGGAFAESLGNGIAAQMAGGALSGFLATAFTDAYFGREPGRDVFESAAWGAFYSGMGATVREAALSYASAVDVEARAELTVAAEVPQTETRAPLLLADARDGSEGRGGTRSDAGPMYESYGGDQISIAEARKPGKTPPKRWPDPPANVVGSDPNWNSEGYWEGRGKHITWDDRSHGTGIDRGRGPQGGHWDDEKSGNRWRPDGTLLPGSPDLERAGKSAAIVGGGYLIYRFIRFLPSLALPPTIPANLAMP